MPLAESDRIYLSGLLHDVGKIGIRDDVLLKQGRLTEDEFAEIKKHPQIGYSIVRNLSQLEDVLPGILHHHEAMDGSGYPHGLAGDQIPLMARILAVADGYDAMTSDRPYRPGMSWDRAVAILRDRSGRQWDREVVAAFLKLSSRDISSSAVPHGLAGWQLQEDVLRRAVDNHRVLARTH
jgi:HD-GYP domain-containing protein (c-di-GMP phosphodiesterase class II)